MDCLHTVWVLNLRSRAFWSYGWNIFSLFGFPRGHQEFCSGRLGGGYRVRVRFTSVLASLAIGMKLTTSKILTCTLPFP